MKDLKTKAVRGGLAKACSQVGNMALRIGSLMILARLLEPGDFGLVAMVTALTGVLQLFRDFGLSAATVQRTTITKEQMSTLFWVNLLVGAGLAFLAFALAPAVARFYHEPRLLGITTALSAGFVFNGAGIQHAALLQREMRFTVLAGIETASLVVCTAVGIAMGLLGLGYWALVGIAVMQPMAYSILVWIAASWLPGRPGWRVGVGAMMRFGGTITLNSIVTYVAYNLEKILLGRVWGAEALGIYGRAYQLVNLPIENLNSSVGEVAFSALSRIKEDPERLKNYFLKGYTLVVSLTLPITVACTLFADELIQIVLGAKWRATVPIFRVLAPTILIFALINPMWWLLVSLGLVGRSLKIATVLAPLVMTGYLIGLPYGPIGVATGFSTVMALWVLPHLAWCARGTGVPVTAIIRVVGRPLLAAIIAGSVAAGTVHFVPDLLSAGARVLIGIPLLFVTYAVMLLYGMRQKAFYFSILRALRKERASPENISL